VSRPIVVYRSTRIDGMYLFVDASARLERVPADLMARFGRPIEVLAFDLWPHRALARSSAVEVLAAIERHGFHLQLPPTPERRNDDH
jgi:uncharacterized protein YcgL (UPF0745 family)